MFDVKSYGDPADCGERKALVGSGYELLRESGGWTNISLWCWWWWCASSSYGSLAKPSSGSIGMDLISSNVGCVGWMLSNEVNGGRGYPMSGSSLPHLDSESLKTESALCTSQFSAIAGSGGVGEAERMDEPELESWRRA